MELSRPVVMISQIRADAIQAQGSISVFAQVCVTGIEYIFFGVPRNAGKRCVNRYYRIVCIQKDDAFRGCHEDSLEQISVVLIGVVELFKLFIERLIECCDVIKHSVEGDVRAHPGPDRRQTDWLMDIVNGTGFKSLLF